MINFQTLKTCPFCNRFLDWNTSYYCYCNWCHCRDGANYKFVFNHTTLFIYIENTAYHLAISQEGIKLHRSKIYNIKPLPKDFSLNCDLKQFSQNFFDTHFKKLLLLE